MNKEAESSSQKEKRSNERKRKRDRLNGDKQNTSVCDGEKSLLALVYPLPLITVGVRVMAPSQVRAGTQEPPMFFLPLGQ